jgi:glycosyltransferase involved in cell wall biosynthesis
LDYCTYNRSDAVIAVNRVIAQHLERSGVRPKNLKIISHGIVGRDQALHLQESRCEASPGCSFIIVFVGRLSVEKGCVTLLEAARLLKDRRLNFKLFIVGDGPERSTLEHLVETYRLGTAVTFEGWQLNPTPYYQRADVVAVPSLTEGQPLIVLEAMLYGRAVVASRVGGIPEIVRDRQNGILVEPQNSLQLADVLEEYLRDPELRTRFGRAGQHYVCENHTIERMVEQTLMIYEDALAHSRPHAEIQ